MSQNPARITNSSKGILCQGQIFVFLCFLSGGKLIFSGSGPDWLLSGWSEAFWRALPFTGNQVHRSRHQRTLWVSERDGLSNYDWMYSIMHERRKKVTTSWFICSQLFCDFGDEFEVLDRDGETPVSAMIQGISKVQTSVCFMLHIHSVTLKPAESHSHLPAI